jgi:hypothetical protein
MTWWRVGGATAVNPGIVVIAGTGRDGAGNE